MALKNIAILIDADNTEVGLIGKVLETLSLQGDITTKRAYGNWKKEQLKPWEEVCIKYAIHPIQQYDYVQGKNATDLAVAIDAKNLLHSGRYDGFAIVSSDSDFTPLLIELREHGMQTFAFGNSNTKESLKNACVAFYNIDEFKESKASKKEDDKPSDDIDSLLARAFDEYKLDSGYAMLSIAGDYLRRVKPDFNIKTYGAKSLSEYIKTNKETYEVKVEHIDGLDRIWFKIK